MIKKTTDYSNFSPEQRAKHVKTFLRNFFNKIGNENDRFRQLILANDSGRIETYLAKLDIKTTELEKLFVINFLDFWSKRGNPKVNEARTENNSVYASITTNYSGFDLRDINLIIEDFLKKNKFQDTFSTYVLGKLAASGEDEVDFYERCGLNRNQFSQLRSRDRGPKSYTPTRIKAIVICLGLKLNLAEMEKCLSLTGYALNKASDFDMTIKYFVENGIYDFKVINRILLERKLECLPNYYEKK
jgi:hypothetical protein